MRVVGDDSDTEPDGGFDAVPAPDIAAPDVDEADIPEAGDEPDADDPGDDVPRPGFGAGGKDNGAPAPDPELVDSGRERSSDDAVGPVVVDPDEVEAPPGVRRTTVLEESVVFSSRAAVGVPSGPGLSVTGAEAWVGSVAAPAAPDFACVSVIDQSCSLGSGGWADVSAVRLGSREGVGPAVILATQLRSRPVRQHFWRSPRQSRPPADP